jgi:hypothetical protein
MISAVNSGFYSALKLWPEVWTANTAYAIGELVRPTVYASHCYKCTIAGTSHITTEPTWGTTNGQATTDNSITWICWGPQTFQVVAPQTSVLPYVIFGMEVEVPVGTFADFEAIENLTYYVNCFSDKSPADIAEITDEVMDALDNVNLTITGYTTMKCKRDYLSPIIYDSEVGVYQASLRYRLMLDKS